MKGYELTLILDPKLKDTDFSQLQSKIEKWLTGDKKAKIEKKEDLGTKDFAYPISKNQQGRYLFYVLQADPVGFLDLEKNLRLEEKVLRYLLIRKD